MNNKYPSTLTATNSPNATNPTEGQNGSSNMKCNSAPTINALAATGTRVAKAKCLNKYTSKQEISVAALPMPASIIPRGENRLDRKQPRVRPNAKSNLKKQSSTNASAIRTCTARNAKGLVAIVIPKYKAATTALKAMERTTEFFILRV